MTIFNTARCGVLQGDGCGNNLPSIEAFYIGDAFVAGKLVSVFKQTEENICPHCGRKSIYIYCKLKTNLTIIQRQEAEIAR